MCGIAGVYLKAAAPDILRERIEPFVDNLYKGIEARGKHATGFVAVSNTGEIRIDKDAKTASKFIKDRERLPNDLQCVLLHTRYKTKGSEKDFRNNHPVIWKTCFTTHNGSVNNDDRLFAKYELERHAEVDSEIISALMHQSGFDLTQMQTYIDEMQGPIAMATINPTEHPGVLVLAKTYTSPLFFINTRQMVVWASEVDAMRNAWGKVLGTPPEKKKFTEVPQRTILVVENDRMQRHNIPFRYSGGAWQRPSDKKKDEVSCTVVHEHGERQVRSPLQERIPFGMGSYPVMLPPAEKKDDGESYVGEAVTNEAIKNKVLALREAGLGEAITITEMRTLPFSSQFGPWRACEICAVMVQADELTDTIRGEACADCKNVWRELSNHQREESVEGEVVIDESKLRRQSILSMAQNTLRYVNVQKLNFFAADEEVLHRAVLSQMASSLPIDTDALDYMMFRADTLDVEDHPVLSEMVPALVEVYEDIREELGEWLQVNEEDFFEAFKDKDAVDAPVEAAKKEKSKPQFRFAPVVCSAAKQNPDTCAFCKKKQKNSIERDEGKIMYCAAHFDVCNTRGCKGKAQYTRTDGIRVCHTHARNVKGCVNDNTLSEEGYLVGRTEE